ncbi:unnamed protein product [Mesocestoides corti]|uniref:Muscleblind-like CCCH zinc finger domain-containing protein n=1 Tax=Mesocestoides corti TaxID=53468 RepID=A0A0R3UJY3_MESCO|nr:unnamed protein product [Mesocestoides corti]
MSYRKHQNERICPPANIYARATNYKVLDNGNRIVGAWSPGGETVDPKAHWLQLFMMMDTEGSGARIDAECTNPPTASSNWLSARVPPSPHSSPPVDRCSALRRSISNRFICLTGKCQRRDPPCKYFHPPQHLRELLLQNGRNNLILKSMQLQLLQQQFAQGAMLPGLSAALAATASPTVPVTAATHGSAGDSRLGAAPASPAATSAAASITSTGKLLYPPTPSLNLAAPGMAAAYSLLLAQVFTPKSAVIDPIYANLYATGEATQQVTRKRPANCINEPVFAALYQSPFLGYNLQLDPQYLAEQSAAAAQLGVGLSPYLTPTQLNSMAAAAATAAALKAVPPTVSLASGAANGGAGGLSAAHMAAMAAAAAAAVTPMAAPGTPAKRPALTDAKSGLPMFDCGQGLYALQPQGHLPTKTPATSSSVTQNNGAAQESGGQSEAEGQQAQVGTVGQYYPETYIEIPQYGYK